MFLGLEEDQNEMEYMGVQPIDRDTLNADRAAALSYLAQGFSSDEVAVRLGFLDGDDVVAILDRAVPRIEETGETELPT